MEWNDLTMQWKKFANKFISDFEKSLGFETKIKWDNAIKLIGFHVFGFFWSYFYAFPAKWQTIVYGESKNLSQHTSGRGRIAFATPGLAVNQASTEPKCLAP